MPDKTGYNNIHITVTKQLVQNPDLNVMLIYQLFNSKLTYFLASIDGSSQSNDLQSTEECGGEAAIVLLWCASYEKHL